MRILRRVVLPTVLVAVVVTVAAAVLRGSDGLLGALAGGAIALVFLGSSPSLLEPVARRSAAASLPFALAFYGLKAVVVFVAVALLLDPSVIGVSLDEESLGAAMVVVALTWVTAHLLAFRRARTPTYDPDNNP